ncbi:hypothetical protein CRG98_004788 [Punica granatum]|uniref:Uncharacterized protein n=1 Tax=Punica granatum TaxID=22663 RepID=A0A2I0L2E7_PUNGR|nr:hypothetical protein CRG98_004788 [Punica granatum]
MPTWYNTRSHLCSRFNQNSRVGSVSPVFFSISNFAGPYGSGQILARLQPPIGAIIGLLEVQRNHNVEKKPPRSTGAALTADAASRIYLVPVGRDPQSLRNPMQPAPHEKANPINWYSLDKPDCQSGLPVNLIAPVLVTHFTGSNTPNHRLRGPTPPTTPSACNPSAECGLAPIQYLAPRMVYVEDTTPRWRQNTTYSEVESFEPFALANSRKKIKLARSKTPFWGGLGKS